MKRIIKIALFAFVLIAGLVVLAVYWTFYRPQPHYEATIQLPELQNAVEIYWGPYGVPHIYAENKHDLYFALGYVHAQDRLWQMTLSQLAAQGRFAEFLGEDLLPLDKFQRTIGFWRIAQKMKARLPDSTMKMLQAYAVGINRYAALNKRELPLQFALTGIEPIKWTPTHSLAIARLMAWELNTAWKMELTYTQLSQKLPPRKFNELFPRHKIEVSPDTLSDTGSIISTVQAFMNAHQTYKHLMNIQGGLTGSNAWAVSGSRTTSGKPLLAGDPHLALNIPGKWYEVHLNLNGKNLSGATIPGAPAVILGQNDVLAWSLTNVMLDDTDFYKEIVHPADSSRYLSDSLSGEAVYESFIIQREVINVKNGDDVAFTRKLTKHGPVISGIFGSQLPENSVITMQWTGFQPGRELQALQIMGWADSFTEFREGIKLFKVPAQNITYADTGGNIALFTMARVPLRQGNPLLVRPGWNPEFEWQGFVPFQELPYLVNPEKGWVANANNAVADSTYPHYISAYWASDSRYLRIRQYLKNNDSLTVQAFQVMQYDVYSVYSEKLTELILPVLESSRSDFPIAVEYLSNWEYAYLPAETAASIIEVFKLQLSKNVFRDEMGSETYSQFVSFAAKPERLLLRLLKNNSVFFDDVQTPAKETRSEIIRKSMRQAITYLKENLGKEPSTWRWENLHRLTLKPPFFGRAAEQPDAPNMLQLIVENVMNNGPYGIRGNGTVIHAGSYSWNNPYAMTAGSSILRIIDLSDTRQSLSILPAGQSGNPLSPYYGDQTQNWLNGQYKFFNQHSSLFTDYKLMRLVPEK